MEVVPKLVAALTDSELRVRMAATDALRQVAPKLNFWEVQVKFGVQIFSISFQLSMASLIPAFRLELEQNPGSVVPSSKAVRTICIWIHMDTRIRIYHS